MPSFAFVRRLDAPIDIVWDILTKHAAYEEWGAVESSVLEANGTPDLNGVGAIRRLKDGPLVVREKVLEFEPKTRFTYTVLSGPPVRDYLGTVVLAPDGSSTEVRWSVEFESKIPFAGPILRPVVKHVIRTLLTKATAEAARRHRR